MHKDIDSHKIGSFIEAQMVKNSFIESTNGKKFHRVQIKSSRPLNFVPNQISTKYDHTEQYRVKTINFKYATKQLGMFNNPLERWWM